MRATLAAKSVKPKFIMKNPLSKLQRVTEDQRAPVTQAQMDAAA
jgi:hypothetical protein